MSGNRFERVPPYEWTEIEDTGLEVRWEGTHDGAVRVQQDENDERPVVILLPEAPGGWRVRQAEY